MDVIVLAQAGLNEIAPLGTALTESHIAQLKLADEPVLCFDGDKAACGRRAARRNGRCCWRRKNRSALSRCRRERIQTVW